MTALAARAERRPVRAGHWLAAAALASVAAIAADALRAPPTSHAEPLRLDPGDLHAGYGPATYAEALARADSAVAGARNQLESHPGEWLRIEVLARALTARHRLTAEPADLAEADRLLDRALELAPWPAGPSLSRAQVSLAAHDLDGAERALARFDAQAVPGSSAEQAEARSIRCEIAFERGRLAEARQLCAGDDLASSLRRANLELRTGHADEAARIVEALLRLPRLPPQTVATMALQRASVALATGDWEAAGAWSRAAERAFPGYWLSEAALAQQAALEGDFDDARRRYAALAERTGHPDVLDALARLTTGAEAARWSARAGTAWADRARVLPAAYEMHHAEHLLLNGQPRAALARAEGGHARRPYSGTIAHYGYALWRNGQSARALAVVREGQSRGFLTADIKLVEALALGALGRSGEAGRTLAEARRLNPRIDSQRQQFVVFGRD